MAKVVPRTERAEHEAHCRKWRSHVNGGPVNCWVPDRGTTPGWCVCACRQNKVEAKGEQEQEKAGYHKRVKDEVSV